ncbi:MAG: PQQ-binding-like beta-propeller repeat protein [Acidobacteriota bacterium]
MTLRTLACSAVLILCWRAAVLHCDHWPQFRGPDGTGISESSPLPVEFGPSKNLVWRVPVPPGHSSPVIWGDRIFFTAFEGKNLLTLCLDRASGKTLWKQEAPRDRFEPYQSTNTPTSPTPVTDGRQVYVFFGDFGLIAYTIGGAEIWRLPMGPFNNVNGHGSSPILADGKVILICDQDTDSYLIAVDQKTGKPVWKTPRPEVTRGYATPAVYRPAGAPAELIVPGAYQVAGYSLETGRKLWWVRGMAWQLKSVPLIEDDILYVSGWEIGGDTEKPPEIPSFEEILEQHDRNRDGRLGLDELASEHRIYPDEDLNHDGQVSGREWEFRRARRTAQNNIAAIRTGGKGDVTDTHVLWRYRKSLPNVPSPLLYRNVIFLVKDGGITTTLNPETGTVLKQGRLPGATEHYWSSPVAGDNKVYLVSEAGKVSVLKATGNWEVLALNDLREDCYATPAIVDGKIYLRTRSHLYCFGLLESADEK